MSDTGYINADHRKQIDNRMSRLLSKAEITESENRVLRGFLSSIEISLKR